MFVSGRLGVNRGVLLGALVECEGECGWPGGACMGRGELGWFKKKCGNASPEANVGRGGECRGRGLREVCEGGNEK